VLKVTESRVCQLHGQALVRLKARLAQWRDQPQAAPLKAARRMSG
jgi:RNA polymerase sigma factor FliA